MYDRNDGISPKLFWRDFFIFLQGINICIVFDEDIHTVFVRRNAVWIFTSNLWKKYRS